MQTWVQRNQHKGQRNPDLQKETDRTTQIDRLKDTGGQNNTLKDNFPHDTVNCVHAFLKRSLSKKSGR